MYKIIDFKTKESVVPRDLVFTGANAQPWEVVMDMDLVKSRINTSHFKSSPPMTTKYLPLLPIKDQSKFITLGEGVTPLIKSQRIGKELGVELYFKLESRNPTGAFKDRGSAVEITIAKEMGAKGITVASTGNMAASCSCYAAAANIPCFVFVPEDTPQSKLAQVISYGGKIVQVKGSYGDAARLAEEVALELGFYLAGDYAFRVEGGKTAAFEVIEQLFFTPPDAVIVPIGCGTNLASYMKGFEEYQELGFIDKIPKIYGSQALGANTVAGAFDQNLKDGLILESARSVAGAICINHALDGAKALDAIYKTKGKAIALSDKEILKAQYDLSKDEGIFVEAACASTLSLLREEIKNNKEEFAGKKIVLVLTGSGLKDPAPVLRIAIKPPTILPSIKEFSALYKEKFFDGKSVAFIDREKVIFTKQPSLKEVKDVSIELFDANYSDTHLNKMLEQIEKILIKGKPVTFSDFQDVIQDALEANTGKKVFFVKDFGVETARDRKATSIVTVLLDGEELCANAEGVGPVDAIINALKKACGEKLDFSLSDYKVAIRSSGTNAVVNTEMKLQSGNKSSVGTGASPDIIQASIEAFEQAYNGLLA